MINVIIDELTLCLKEAETGTLVETEAIPIRDTQLLKGYNRKNGWYVNWPSLLKENEVYALVIKDTSDIQGLVALRNDVTNDSVYVAWMCTSPTNNKLLTSKIKYEGVGGHLFAIAIQKSIDYGNGGYIYGFASNQKLLNHYMEKLGARHIGMLHPYHFSIDESRAKQIKEVYNFEWSDKPNE